MNARLEIRRKPLAWGGSLARIVGIRREVGLLVLERKGLGH
ncbi:MAG TPA: hypothetical protein VF924_12105 [Stellaceae bacterium]|jgi:hypothetical protein